MKNLSDAMEKLRINHNKRNKREGMCKAILCVISIGMTLLTGCTADNKKNTSSLPSKEQVSDSTIQDSLPTPPSETTDTPTLSLSIFDKLANDMVYVECDSGSFYICKYEVTQKLWSEVMGDNPSEMQGDDLPVENVSWNDCQVFISKLNELTGKNYRLPTEAEWEFACRGGKYSKGYKYSGSDNLDEVAWYDVNSEDKTHPVGQKKPNELGLYDMNGNVWELCQDLHDLSRSCRGGSWIHNARNCDPSLVNETPQAFKINSLGLRLAL